MTKQELIERVYRKCGTSTGITKKAVTEIIDGVFAELGNYFVKAKMSKNPRFTYPGFGTFSKKRREVRTGRHPQTGEPIEIPATITIAFSIGSKLKELINER